MATAKKKAPSRSLKARALKAVSEMSKASSWRGREAVLGKYKKVPKKKPKLKTTWPTPRPKAKQPALVKYVADRARDYIANRIREKDLAEVWRKLKVTTPTARSVKIVGPGGTVEFRMGQETVFINGPGQAMWDYYLEDAGLVREEGGKDSLNRPDIAGEFVEEYMKEALFTAIDGATGASRDDLYPHLKGRIKAKKPWWKVW